jgi:hypothetical protein
MKFDHADYGHGILDGDKSYERTYLICTKRYLISSSILPDSFSHLNLQLSRNSATAKYPLLSTTPLSFTTAVYFTTHCGSISPLSPSDPSSSPASTPTPFPPLPSISRNVPRGSTFVQSLCVSSSICSCFAYNMRGLGTTQQSRTFIWSTLGRTVACGRNLFRRWTPNSEMPSLETMFSECNFSSVFQVVIIVAMSSGAVFAS